MKRVRGIKDRDDRWRGVEILMTDVFAKIKPTDLFKFGAKEAMVLVRSRCCLEDGGGLPACRVIYTQRQVSVVFMGT
jgi:hypothetical protein